MEGLALPRGYQQEREEAGHWVKLDAEPEGCPVLQECNNLPNVQLSQTLPWCPPLGEDLPSLPLMLPREHRGMALAQPTRGSLLLQSPVHGLQSAAGSLWLLRGQWQCLLTPEGEVV